MQTDTQIIEWLERNHTLHRKVEALYVVDGYEVTITHDDSRIAGPWHAPTLREAYQLAMQEWDGASKEWSVILDMHEPHRLGWRNQQRRYSMKVRVYGYSRDRAHEVPLEHALTPSSYEHSGIAEDAKAQATAAADAIGRLLAVLVERGVLTFDQAKAASGAFGDMELVQ